MKISKIFPKRYLGQNFLRNPAVVKDLIDASEPKSSDSYLEIGPGEGAVTKILAPKVKKVIAVELDHEMVQSLQKSFTSIDNITIVRDDALRFLTKRSTLDANHFNKIIGSIPYQITSPLLHALVDLSLSIKLDNIVLLIQKEVAQKICAQPPRASYLSNLVQTYFSVEYVTTVSKESFYPIPKVDGAVVKLEPGGLDKKILVVEPKEWSTFLHQGFKHPRKMIKRVFDEKILKESGIKVEQRPSSLKLADWITIYEKQKVLGL